METLVEVGRVRKVHGYKGELKLIVNDGYEDDVEQAAFLFFGSSHDNAVPHEVAGLRGADWIVSLRDVSTKEEVGPLLNKKLYLRQSEISDKPALEAKPNDNQYARFVGFTVVDDDLGTLGVITATAEHPQQVLATVRRKPSAPEVLVPMNPHLIKGVDFTSKVVFMVLPEGLVDLNRSSSAEP